jgi:predicted AAA+ superfamily ATPase
MKVPNPIKRRDSYLQKIKPFMRTPLIKVMSGQRRVGKSYILLQLMQLIKTEEPDANIIYINKEDMAFAFIDSAQSLNDYIVAQSRPNQWNFIFIDEIQDIPEFEKALRSLLLNEKNDIYITGSNAKMLSGELATYLSGRYIEFTIYSLSYLEFLDFHHLPDNDDSYSQYAKYGGLPYLIHLPMTDHVVFEYLNSIYSTIVYRDVVNRYAVRNTDFLEKLVRFLANNTGSLFSAKSISDYLKSQNTKLAPNQVLQYTSHLVSAFIIHQVQRYDVVGKHIFEVGEKFYFENMGIRHVVGGYKIQDQAKILENIVYNHLVYKGYKVFVGAMEGQEIDFVCEKSGEKLYVQVALSLDSPDTFNREFGNLLKIEDNYPKIVVSREHFEGNTYEGIRHMRIREFLTATEI